MKSTCFCLIFAAFLSAEQFPTYFQYNTSEINKICETDSTKRMSKEELQKWDDIAEDLSAKNPGPENTRFYAYLYTGQKEVAYLSYNCHGQFVGDLSPISAKIIHLFFPSEPEVESDEYSEYLADVVFAKLKQRCDEEDKEMKEYPIVNTDSKLNGFPKPNYGLKSATCKPWLIDNPKQFMAAKPPAQNDPYWAEQSKIVKQISDNTSEEEMPRIKFWAGEGSPKNGNWMAMANDYMFSQNIPFAELLFVRSLLAQAGIDVDMALFYSKYTYLIKRPAMVNSEITQRIVLPKHPSYPSGHSTWSPACATILSYYFPEKKDYWFNLAEEAGQSRIKAGIHYPIDHQNGWKLGTQLGNKILQSPKIITPDQFQDKGELALPNVVQK